MRDSSTLGNPARQRWRLAYRRGPDAPRWDQREAIAAWEAAIAASGLPFATTERAPSTPRVSLGVSLPVGMVAERELIDVFLASSVPITMAREALDAAMPTGHELVELHDVWVGAPALRSVVSSATYRVVLAADPPPPTPEALRSAAAALLANSSIPRTREKGGRRATYDLRPLLDAVSVDEGTMRITVTIDPELGMGRPEEVVAALEAILGAALAIGSVVREGVRTRDE